MTVPRPRRGRHRVPAKHCWTSPGAVTRACTRVPALGTIASMAGLSVAQTACNAVIALIGTVSLGATGRGVMVIGVTLGSLLIFIGGLGTGPALRAQYPSTSGVERAALVAAYTWWSAAGTVLTPLLAVASTAWSARLIDPALAEPHFLVAVGVYTASQLLMNQFVEAWYADGRFAHAVGSAAAMGAVSLVAVLVCLGITRSPAALLMAQGLGATVACVVVGVQQRAAGLLDLHRPRQLELRSLVRVGMPALGVNVGLAIVLRADRYLLGLVSGPTAVGIYSLAATLSEIPRVVPTATGQVLMREVAVGRGVQAAGLLLRPAVLITAAGSVLGGVAGWLLIPPLFGAEFVEARLLLVVLLAAEVCFAPYALASRGLLGGGWTVTAGSLGMLGAVLGIACYALSTNVAGAPGAAVGSIVVYGGLSAAAWALLRRRLNVGGPPPDRSIASTGTDTSRTERQLLVPGAHDDELAAGRATS